MLPADSIARLPVRFTFSDCYFDDDHEGLPLARYGAVFTRMLSHENIVLKMPCNYFDVLSRIPAGKPTIYTGPIDRFFRYRAGILGWRTLDFEREALPVDDFQGASVVSYPDEDVAFTRIHEFRHLHPERRYPSGQTVIFREYSRFATTSPIIRSTDRPIRTCMTHIGL